MMVNVLFVIVFVNTSTYASDHQPEKTAISQTRFAGGISILPSKFFGWKKRYGKVDAHNGDVPWDC